MAISTGNNRVNAGIKMVPGPNPEKKVKAEAINAVRPTHIKSPMNYNPPIKLYFLKVGSLLQFGIRILTNFSVYTAL